MAVPGERAAAGDRASRRVVDRWRFKSPTAKFSNRSVLLFLVRSLSPVSIFVCSGVATPYASGEFRIQHLAAGISFQEVSIIVPARAHRVYKLRQIFDDEFRQPLVRLVTESDVMVAEQFFVFRLRC